MTLLFLIIGSLIFLVVLSFGVGAAAQLRPRRFSGRANSQ